MAEVMVGSQRIYMEDMGAGPPVVLLHSSGMGARQWRRLAGLLSSRYRVLAPDLIGYGKSGPWLGTEDFRYEADLRVAEEIARSAGAPAHLVGHSYGGFLALLLAASRQVPVASVAVYEPVAFGVLFSSHDEIGIRDLEAVEDGGEFFAPELEGTETWCERFVDFWGGRGYWARLPPPMKTSFQAAGRKMFQEVRSLTHDRTPESTYATIEQPTLLMSGSESPVSERRVMATLARAMPQAQSAAIQGAGHMGPLTHASQVDRLVMAHIDGASGRT